MALAQAWIIVTGNKRLSYFCQIKGFTSKPEASWIVIVFSCVEDFSIKCSELNGLKC